MDYILKKQILLICSFCFLFNVCWSQDLYRFNYKFQSKKFDNHLFRLSDSERIISLDTFHLTLNNKNRILKVDTLITDSAFVIKIKSKKLFGTVSSRSGDSLFIKFWYIKPSNDSFRDSARYVNSINVNSRTDQFFYLMQTGQKHFSIPFKAVTVSAINIPFRVRLQNPGGLDADFLNSAITVAKIFGRATYFEEEEILPKTFYYGLGGFAGVSQLVLDSANTNNQLSKIKNSSNKGSFMYGINGIVSYRNVSLIITLGFENAMGRNAGYWIYNNFNKGIKPWIGFGFGFKLFDIGFTPSN